MHKILINALGTESSGGISILRKTLQDVSLDEESQYHIFIYTGKYIDSLLIEKNYHNNLHFRIMKNYGLIYRVLFENIFMPFYINKNNISLIYNLTGTSQFFSGIPSIVKIQNLLFFTKGLDMLYFKRNKRLLWLKHIYYKRIVLSLMLRVAKNIEIQSINVKKELSNFVDLNNKNFFLKNDFSISNDDFSSPKKYDFKSEIIFLYIVGPHFNMPHKNIDDFIRTMVNLLDFGLNFHIQITLTRQQLENSDFWDKKLNKVTSFLGYIDNKKAMQDLFADNVVLISTSVIETIGLHVIEAVLNGILCIVPNESYSAKVYGSRVLTYNLFNSESLMEAIINLKSYNNNKCQGLIIDNQNYIRQNENEKYQNSLSIIKDVLNKGK